MLTLTPMAAQAVQTLVHHRKIDDDTGGLRIGAPEAPEPGRTVELAIVAGPEAADAEIDSRGARLFVEPALTEALGDKVLDARVEGDVVRFALLARADGGLLEPW